MANMKTVPTDSSVEKFLKGLKNERQRGDAFALLKMMKSVTRKKPKIWGDSMVGFGSYHYKYETGREGDMLMTGFSPRSKNLVVYVMPGFERYSSLMKKLGKHKTGRSCLYFNKLEDLGTRVLKELVTKSYGDMKKKYG